MFRMPYFVSKKAKRHNEKETHSDDSWDVEEDTFMILPSTATLKEDGQDNSKEAGDSEWEMIYPAGGLDDRPTKPNNINAHVTTAPITMSKSCRQRNPFCQTFGTMGKGESILQDNQEAILFEYHADVIGGSCYKMTHFWVGGNFSGVEDLRIRYYIDAETTASIDMQLYLGHGIGFGDAGLAPWITQYIGKVGKHNGIHNNYPIPFGKSIRVTATWLATGGDRQEQHDDAPLLWWILRGISLFDLQLSSIVTLGGIPLPTAARLHLVKLEQYLAQPLEEFDLCLVPKGPGALFQVTIAAQSTNLSYLEACMRAYMDIGNDNDDNSTTTNNSSLVYLSSGLEDYFLGTYYFNTGQYYSDMAGVTHLDRANCQFSAYRFHDHDPVVFHNGFRLTCRCGETPHGTAQGKALWNPQPTTYTTYVWYYQW